MGIFCHIAETENISATVMNICSKLINIPIYSQRRKKIYTSKHDLKSNIWLNDEKNIDSEKKRLSQCKKFTQQKSKKTLRKNF